MALTLDGTSGITGNSGTLLSNSTIGVGAATPAASGAGITFPAAQSASTDANTLDDYEEGTFTPTLTPNTSGSITVDTSNDTLSYTKIGRQVTIIGQVNVSSVSSPVGTYISLSNLPFTSADLSELAGRAGNATSFYDDSAGTVTTQGNIMLENTTTLRIYMTAANVAASDAFIFSFSYFV